MILRKAESQAMLHDRRLLYQKISKMELSAASLAQLVERALRKRKVARSTRARGIRNEPFLGFKVFVESATKHLKILNPAFTFLKFFPLKNESKKKRPGSEESEARSKWLGAPLFASFWICRVY